MDGLSLVAKRFLVKYNVIAVDLSSGGIDIIRVEVCLRGRNGRKSAIMLDFPVCSDDQSPWQAMSNVTFNSAGRKLTNRSYTLIPLTQSHKSLHWLLLVISAKS
jgi:hypothetical protein